MKTTEEICHMLASRMIANARDGGCQSTCHCADCRAIAKYHEHFSPTTLPKVRFMEGFVMLVVFIAIAVAIMCPFILIAASKP
jgi:hypothetical protein